MNEDDHFVADRVSILRTRKTQIWYHSKLNQTERLSYFYNLFLDSALSISTYKTLYRR